MNSFPYPQPLWTFRPLLLAIMLVAASSTYAQVITDDLTTFEDGSSITVENATINPLGVEVRTPYLTCTATGANPDRQLATYGAQVFIYGSDPNDPGGESTGLAASFGLQSPQGNREITFTPNDNVYPSGSTLTVTEVGISAVFLQFPADTNIRFEGLKQDGTIVSQEFLFQAAGGGLQTPELGDYSTKFFQLSSDFENVVSVEFIGNAGGINGEDQVGQVEDVSFLIHCPTDRDLDGDVDSLDLLDFQAAWFALDSSADWDDNGVIDVFDLLAFQAQWFPDTVTCAS